jgi:hypothetical protein
MTGKIKIIALIALIILIILGFSIYKIIAKKQEKSQQIQIKFPQIQPSSEVQSKTSAPTPSKPTKTQPKTLPAPENNISAPKDAKPISIPEDLIEKLSAPSR